MSDHPTRQDLMSSAQAGQNRFTSHLKNCSECQFLYNIWNGLGDEATLELPAAPNMWVERAARLMSKPALLQTLANLAAKLSFDSWSALPAIEVRDSSTAVRRLGFECGEHTLHIQATYRESDWNFVARFADNSETVDAIIKLPGAKTIYPDEDGYFIWQSTTPPRKLFLEFSESSYEIKDLKWKTTNN